MFGHERGEVRGADGARPGVLGRRHVAGSALDRRSADERGGTVGARVGVQRAGRAAVGAVECVDEYRLDGRTQRDARHRVHVRTKFLAAEELRQSFRHQWDGARAADQEDLVDVLRQQRRLRHGPPGQVDGRLDPFGDEAFEVLPVDGLREDVARFAEWRHDHLSRSGRRQLDLGVFRGLPDLRGVTRQGLVSGPV